MVDSLDKVDQSLPNVSIHDGVLSDREYKFVVAYCGVANFNTTKAAEIAGFPKRSAYARGYEVKNREHVRARIRAYLESEGLSDEEWLHHITDVARRPLDDFVMVIARDHHGDPVVTKMDASAKMKALEMFAKARGLFTDKIDVEVTHVERRIVGIDPDTFEMLDTGAIEAEGDVT